MKEVMEPYEQVRQMYQDSWNPLAELRLINVKRVTELLPTWQELNDFLSQLKVKSGWYQLPSQQAMFYEAIPSAMLESRILCAEMYHEDYSTHILWTGEGWQITQIEEYEGSSHLYTNTSLLTTQDNVRLSYRNYWQGSKDNSYDLRIVFSRFMGLQGVIA